MQLVPVVLPKGAPRVLKSTPAEAVLSLDMTVLLMMLVFSASSREIPAPSQPATLLTMMLLVINGAYHGDRDPVIPGKVTKPFPFGKLTTSEPLMFCRAKPPPLPLSAWLPIIRLALMIRLGPTPSLKPGAAQSRSVVAPHVGSISGVPMARSPPPLVTIVGLLLWLNRIVLCSMSPE